MEFFVKAKEVRLKSYYHDKFLIADEDEETVRLSHDGCSYRARWIVEFVQHDSHLIRLRSFVGKYLTASNEQFLLGTAGKKVMQSIPPGSESDSCINWEPRTEGNHVKLRTKLGKFLRGNGGSPPWRNSVTHDIPHRTATQDWVLWKVEMVDILDSHSIQSYVSSGWSLSSSFSSDFAASEFISNDRHESATQIGMELFQKAAVVRLRSHHDKFLIADEDEETVSQDRNGLNNNAKWTVEIMEKSHRLRFRSCFGKYLTASNVPFLFGMSGKKVRQTLPGILDSSVEWEPTRQGMQFKLKSHHGQYLRANSSLPPWRNHITHDIPHRSSTQGWILWDIDLLETRITTNPSPPPSQIATLQAEIVRPERPRRPRNSNQVEASAPSEPGSPTAVSLQFPKNCRNEFDESLVGAAVKNEGRQIHYSVANGNINGEVGDNEKKSLSFKGSVVEELKQKLEEETGLQDIIVCSRNPLNGKLYPLRLHLPPNNANMHVVVFPSSGKA